jgi:hypothetical protein
MRSRPLAIAVCLLAAGGARAQEAGAGAEPAAEAKPEHDLRFVVMPIPVSNPAIGNGLAVAAVGLYRMPGAARPWTTGAAGLYTDNTSWAGGVFQKAYLMEDRLRLTAGAGLGDFKVDFFGIGPNAGRRGRAIPIDQEVAGALVEGLWRIGPNLFAGPHYRFIDMRTTLNLGEVPFPDLVPPEAELRSRVSALGLAAEYDTRDNEFNARRGLYIKGNALKAAKALGGDDNYWRVEASANGYHPLDDKSVLAWRVSICSAGDRAPFYDICNFGMANDLRGYVAGQYRDRAMYAVQAEYRRHLFWRIGGVAFAGVGEVGPSFSRMSTDELLPAAGLGLRIQASKTYRVNAAIDYAWGKDSQAVYFSIGEAF